MFKHCTVERKISFKHRGDTSPVDVVPIGFQLSKNRFVYCSQYFDTSEAVPELLGCLLNRWVINKSGSNSASKKQSFQLLKSLASTFTSEPFLCLEDCAINASGTAFRFVIATDEDFEQDASRLNAFFDLVKTVYAQPPEWVSFLEEDFKRRMPVDYQFEFSLARGFKIVPLRSANKERGGMG